MSTIIVDPPWTDPEQKGKHSRLFCYLHSSSRVKDCISLSLLPKDWLSHLIYLRSSSLIMATGYLKVQGDKIVDENGTQVVLRGAGIGGWMKW